MVIFVNRTFCFIRVGKVFEIDNNIRVKSTKLIGEGGFAYVLKVEQVSGPHVNCPNGMVLKRVLTNEEESLKAAYREVSMMQSIPPFENIINYIGSSTKKMKGGFVEILIVMEFCPDGSLLDLVTKMSDNHAPPLQEKQILKISLDVCKALVHLHSLRPAITHRDIKLENVLYDSASDKYKLIDFGSCSTQSKIYETKQEISQEEEVIQRTTTLMYRAPEMIDLYNRLPVTEKCDVWALGCIIFALAFRRHPFDQGSSLQIMNGKYSIPENHNYSEGLIEVIKMCLLTDPYQRPTSAFVLSALREVQQGKIPSKPTPSNPTTTTTSATPANNNKSAAPPVATPTEFVTEWPSDWSNSNSNSNANANAKASLPRPPSGGNLQDLLFSSPSTTTTATSNSKPPSNAQDLLLFNMPTNNNSSNSNNNKNVDLFSGFNDQFSGLNLQSKSASSTTTQVGGWANFDSTATPAATTTANNNNFANFSSFGNSSSNNKNSNINLFAQAAQPTPIANQYQNIMAPTKYNASVPSSTNAKPHVPATSMSGGNSSNPNNNLDNFFQSQLGNFRSTNVTTSSSSSSSSPIINGNTNNNSSMNSKPVNSMGNNINNNATGKSNIDLGDLFKTYQ